MPIGLGPIGGIEFWEPSRGLLITRGNGRVRRTIPHIVPRKPVFLMISIALPDDT